MIDIIWEKSFLPWKQKASGWGQGPVGRDPEFWATLHAGTTKSGRWTEFQNLKQEASVMVKKIINWKTKTLAMCDHKYCAKKKKTWEKLP
jgi:hypothetical protein